MNNSKTLGLIVAVAVGALASAPAFASGDHGQNGRQGQMMNQQGGKMGHPGGQGYQKGHQGGKGGQGGMGNAQGHQGGMGGNMQAMMMRMHGQMMGGGQMGGGMMGGQMGPMTYLHGMDADDNGKVSPDEARAGLAKKLAEFDANGDGALSIDEFESLHSAAIREKMVDRFQMLDNDGDGAVSAEEMTAPAERMAKMMKRRAASMSGKQGKGMGAGGGAGGGAGMGAGGGDADGSMMQNRDN